MHKNRKNFKFIIKNKNLLTKTIHSDTMYKNTQNYQVLFLTIIFSKTRKVRYKDENKQRIVKRKHKNANIGNGQR